MQKLDSEGEKREISVWQKTHNNTLLDARYRLYLTATPRIFSDKAKEGLSKKSKGKDLMLFSMDDEALFGKEIYSLNFGKAISQNLLSDFRVIISYCREEVVAEYLGKLTKAQENSKLSIESAGKMISLANALRKINMSFVDESGIHEAFEEDKEPMKRAVCFHSSIRNSKFATEQFDKISKNIILDHIDGTHNAYQKAEKLLWLSEEEEGTTTMCRVLSNAKCLTEGIDVPNLDAVCFFDKRDSVVDIVQAVGRAIRKSEGKKYGYIILPLVLTDEEIKNYDKTLKGDKFKIVWQTLKALRSHDERLIDEARIAEVVSFLTNSNEIRELPEATLFTLDMLFNEIKNAVPKNLGDLQYWEHYAVKVGQTMHHLTLRIKNLSQTNAHIKSLFEGFCKALRGNLNASFDTDEAYSLIAQHIITKPIFECIFPNLNFATFDKVSAELEKLYKKLLDMGLNAETEELEKLYNHVRSNAEYAQSDKSKQNLIKNLYENLFKKAFKKMQEKLGIVYTPIEGVDFIIHSVAYALKKHFNKNLSDDNIHICDPFTGTGTFITRLIQSGYLDANLESKYKNELWANEITLLGYYIAQINIATTYHDRLLKLKHSASSPHLTDCEKSEKHNNNSFILFDNLLFTDTFNTYTLDSKGFKGDRQSTTQDFEYFAKNLAKIQEFKNTDFKIFIANPPYSAGQKNANDDNVRMKYPYLESRIAETYVTQSNATKFKYDSFKRAIRYASDRIGENGGIIGFITNGSFIDSKSDDGLRACLGQEFDYVYIFNLRGDINKAKQDKNSGEGENFFGQSSSTSVAITLLIKCGDSNNRDKKAQIHYYDIGDYLSRKQKLNIISNFQSIEGIEKSNLWQNIEPNKDYDWINQRDYSFLEFMPIANKKLKEVPLQNIPTLKNKNKLDSEVLQEGYVDIFEMFSMGINSNRDPWVYNFSQESLAKNMTFMIENYNNEVERSGSNPDYKHIYDERKIKWTRALEGSFKKQIKFDFCDSGLILSAHYRPFTKCHLYLAKHFNEMLCQMPQIYPTPQTQKVALLGCEAGFEAYAQDFFRTHKYLPNITICISDDDGQGGALMANVIVDNGLFKHAQAFPLYYYEKIEIKGTEQGRQSAMSMDNGSFEYGDFSLDSQTQNDNIVYYQRKDAIRDEALAKFQEVYSASKNTIISKVDIFYYIYALLNHPTYQAKYADNLSKMLPRIPFMRDFWGFVESGRKLASLHLNYEGLSNKESGAFACLTKDLKDFKTNAKGLFAKDFREKAAADIASLSESDLRIEKLKFQVKGMTDSIIFNDKIAIVNIPLKAYDYKVNGKSPIEWIMDRYQVKIDKESQIVNDPNLYESEEGALKGLKGGKYVLKLLLSVIEMSVQTMEILESLPHYELIQDV